MRLGVFSFANSQLFVLGLNFLPGTQLEAASK